MLRPRIHPPSSAVRGHPHHQSENPTPRSLRRCCRIVSLKRSVPGHRSAARNQPSWSSAPDGHVVTTVSRLPAKAACSSPQSSRAGGDAPGGRGSSGRRAPAARASRQEPSSPVFTSLHRQWGGRRPGAGERQGVRHQANARCGYPLAGVLPCITSPGSRIPNTPTARRLVAVLCRAKNRDCDATPAMMM